MNISVHSTAIVDDGAQIGAGTSIWHWVHVCGGAKLEVLLLGQNVFIGNKVLLVTMSKFKIMSLFMIM